MCDSAHGNPGRGQYIHILNTNNFFFLFSKLFFQIKIIQDVHEILQSREVLEILEALNGVASRRLTMNFIDPNLTEDSIGKT